MAKLDELVIQLTAETSQLRAELQGAAKATQAATAKMEDAIKSFSENSAKSASFFQTSMATAVGFIGSQAVLGAFNALKSAASAMFGELVKGAESANAQEVAFQRLANSMALTGQYTQESQKDLESFSNEMENMTGVSDDVIASNLALLSSITKLDSEGLKKAQKSALDLSAGLGIDLSTATSMVAKGIEGNVGAFNRYGIEIEKGATSAEGLTNVLKGLAQFNDAAKGSMQTFDGVVLKTTNSWGNLTESLAANVTQNSVVKTVIGEVGKVFDQLTNSADGSSSMLKEGVANSVLFLIDVLGVSVTAADIFIKTFEAGFKAVALAGVAVGETVLKLKDIITGTESEDPFAMTKAGFESLDATLTEETALGAIAQKIAEIRNVSEQSFSKLGDSAAAATPAIQGTAAAVVQLTAAEKQRQEVTKAFAEGLATSSAAIDADYQFQSEMLKANLDAKLISQEEYNTNLASLQATQFETENMALEDARAQNLITEQQYLAAKSQLLGDQAIAEQQAIASQTKFDAEAGKSRLDNMKSTLGAISTLSSSKNKELAFIGKAAAISMATIDGFAAVQKALASAPPPFNFALASLVGIATAANIAKIAGTPLKTGIDSVPGSGSADNFPAMLAPGERVVPTKTNEDLTQFLANGGGKNVTLNINISNMMPASREAGEAMIEAINNALAGGALKILGMA